MNFPQDLTFGVFDSISLDRNIPAPLVCIWQFKPTQGKTFFTVIDGGSMLNPDNKLRRYLMRGTSGIGIAAVESREMPQPGDVIRLLEYSIRNVVEKDERVLMVSRMAIVRHCEDWPSPETRNYVDGYPFRNAAATLSRLQAPPQKSDSPISVQSGGNLYPSLDKPPPFEARPPVDLQRGVQPPRPPSGDGYRPIRKESHSNGAHAGLSPNSAHASRASPYPPQYSSAGPIARRVDASYVEIKNLTTFLGRWTVKGRFINKGEPRKYSNNRGEGKLWSCELMDSIDRKGTIRCTFFNKAVDKFFPLIQENHIYTVTKGTIKAANRQFNAGAHEFEMHLGDDADIKYFAEDDPSIPRKATPKIMAISELINVPRKTSVSVCGILTHVTDVAEIITRSTGQPRTKQEIVLVDDSATSINVTLWGKKIHLLENLDVSQNPVLLVENGVVDEYNGRRLSSAAHTEIKVNPQSVEADRVRRWYLNTGSRLGGQFNSLSTAAWGDTKGDRERVTLSELKLRAAEAPEKELEDKGVWFTVRAILANIDRERQLYWVACPICRKKVSVASDTAADDNYIGNNGENDISFCANCQKEVEQPTKQYLLTVEISDETGSLKCNAMGEAGKNIMGGVDADVLADAKTREFDHSLLKRFGDYFQERLRKDYIFTVQAKSERYRDEQRIRYRIFNAKQLNVPSAAGNAAGMPGQLPLAKEIKIALDFIQDRIATISQ